MFRTRKIARIREITTLPELEQVMRESHERPRLIFKHSISCPISIDVHRFVEKIDADVSMIVVQRSRALSNKVAEMVGVRHESPQAMVIRDGECVFHASHYEVEDANWGDILQ